MLSKFIYRCLFNILEEYFLVEIHLRNFFQYLEYKLLKFEVFQQNLNEKRSELGYWHSIWIKTQQEDIFLMLSDSWKK